ncbi:MAG: hypothetical protein KatS3mg068_1801 [Candidatus Sericytochromatia bacterium]|nr:MAG: hypothetical protein KatS3mg068_1801 [Candidatus Sericytochromatia bacterium]
MIFANKWAFLLFLLIPIYIFLNYRNKDKSFIFNKTDFFENKLTFRIIIYKLLFPLRIIILILLILSIARPQIVNEKAEKIIKGIDLVLTIDLSKSMLAQDLLPDRISVAKEVIINFIKKQKDNRIGLVVFSGRSFTLSPLTTDYKALESMINDLSVETIKVDGTAIGMAILNSIYLFQNNKERTKVVILLTDGENNVNEVSIDKAIKIAKYKNVKIYTIGLGKKEGVPIPIKIFENNVVYARDINGNIIYSKINEEELKKISIETNGLYFNADKKNILEDIYNKINNLEKTEIKLISKKTFEEKFYYFTIPALFFLILEFILKVTYLVLL